MKYRIAFWLITHVKLWFVPKWIGARIMVLAILHAHANRVRVVTPAPPLRPGQKRLRVLVDDLDEHPKPAQIAAFNRWVDMLQGDKPGGTE